MSSDEALGSALRGELERRGRAELALAAVLPACGDWSAAAETTGIRPRAMHEYVVLDCRAATHPYERLKGPGATAVLVSRGSVSDAVLAARAGVPIILEDGPDVARSIVDALDRQHHAAEETDTTSSILGESETIRRVREQLRHIAKYQDVSVLVCGETGTGKELVAEAIHRQSSSTGRFVPLNCAAIPAGLFESELFGHEAGAFTGARGRRIGLVAQAEGGTLFLDEVGELDQQAQAKLLRLLEAREYRAVAAAQTSTFCGRIVAATHRPLSKGDDVGLRADLYFRLSSFVIHVPPLRARRADIPVLAAHFLRSFCARYGRTRLAFEASGLMRLEQHDWPGNVRELRAVVERAAIVCAGDTLRDLDVERGMAPRHVSVAPTAAAQKGTSSLRKVERDMILDAFDSANGNITHAAQRLGIPRTTLRDKLRRYAAGEH